MKIYFFAKNEKNEEKLDVCHQRVIKFFINNGVTTLSNLTPRRADQLQMAFEDMNGLVVEGRGAVQEVGYLVALALAQKKPILYLLPKGADLPDQLRSLKDDKMVKRLFLLKYYTEKTLEGFLVDFLDLIETGELRREVPTIKFTLRFTPRASRYITWKSQQTKLPKADYLRKFIDEQILSDQEYQNTLRRVKDEFLENEDIKPEANGD